MRKPALVDLERLLERSNIAPARRVAVEQVAEKLKFRSLLVDPEHVVEVWQLRFLHYLQKAILRLKHDPEFPPAGLVAFRAIADYVIVETRDLGRLCPWLPRLVRAAQHAGPIDSFDKLGEVFAHYLRDRNGCTKVAIMPDSEVEAAILRIMDRCTVSFGGQAANILALWRAMGGDPRLFIALCSSRLVRAIDSVAGVQDAQLGHFRGGVYTEAPLGAFEHGIVDTAGVRVCDAPSGGSVAVVHRGFRQLWVLQGFRDLDPAGGPSLPVDRLRLIAPASSTPFPEIPAPAGQVWPHITLFGETWIEDSSLVIRLAAREEVRAAYEGKVTTAVLGGLDSLYKDEWLKNYPDVRDGLIEIAYSQMTGLRDAGVRIGVELSAAPGQAYFDFLRHACRQGLIATVGVNGQEKDELPKLVRERGLLSDDDIRTALGLGVSGALPNCDEPHFEYVTYLRARALAADLGVDTLYVHTTRLDYLICRSGAEEARVRVQAAAMVGKGLGLAGLLYRNYGRSWNKQIQRLPAVVNPHGIVRLYEFVHDYRALQGLDETEARHMLMTGLVPGSADGYLVAILPVLWPPEHESPQLALPDNFNSTGAGDMAFGAFFLLQDQDFISWMPTPATSQPATA